MIAALFFLLIFQTDSVITLTVESAAELFSRGTSIAMLADGAIAAVDQGKNSVITVSRRNDIISTVGGKGFGNDAFDMPTDVCSSFLLDLYVVDYNNRRVLRFDKQLNVIQTLNEENNNQLSGRFKPIACAVSAQGDLYVLEQDHSLVAVFNARGQFIREIGSFNASHRTLIGPKDIVISPADEVFVLDKEKIIDYDIFGNILSVIELEKGFEPTSLSFGNNSLIVTSPDRIIILPLGSGRSLSITKASLIGSAATESFADAMVDGSKCIILTQKTLYRCLLP